MTSGTSPPYTPRGVMADDHLLRDILVDEVPRPVREFLLDAPAMMTSDLIMVRLAGAVFKERQGRLTSLLSDSQENDVVAALLDLPDSIQMWALSECVVPVAALTVEFSITTWVALGLEGARRHELYFGADERNTGRNLLPAASALGVPVLLVNYDTDTARVIKP